MLTTIQEIYQSVEKLSQQEKIKVGGWVKSIRESKDIIFIILIEAANICSKQMVFAACYASTQTFLDAHVVLRRKCLCDDMDNAAHRIRTINGRGSTF